MVVFLGLWMVLLGGLLSGAAYGQETPSGGSPWGRTAWQEIDLLFTGGTGGVGSDRYTFEAAARFREAARGSGVDVLGVETLHSVLTQASHQLFAVDNRSASVFAFARGGRPACDEPQRVWLVMTPHEQMIWPQTGLPDALRQGWEAYVEPALLRRCAAGGAGAWWLSPLGASEPEWGLDRWDVRLGFSMKVQGLDGPLQVPVVGLPRQEATRRFRLLFDVLRAEGDAIFVDVGDFIDGVSRSRAGQLSVHRSTGLEMLSRLGPTALVPGAQELAPGPRHLLGEARRYGLPYLATNWQTDDDSLALPRSIVRDVEREGERIRLAFVGVVDPVVMERAPRMVQEGVSLRDPAVAVNEVVEALRSGPEPPDIVVLLGRLEPQTLAAVRSELHGVDVFLGDPAMETYRAVRQEVGLRSVDVTARVAPLSLPLDGVGLARLRWSRGRMDTVRFTPLPVLPDMPADAEVTRRVTRVRELVHTGRDEVIVPVEDGDPLGRMSDESFGLLACDAMREAVGADVGLLARLPSGPQVPGPLTTFLATQRLAVLDTLELHRVDGARLKELLDRTAAVVPHTCGVQGALVGGRSIQPDRVYRVATTDRTRLSTPAGAVLAGVAGQRLLERPSRVQLTLGDPQQPATLQAAVMAVLQTRASRLAEGERLRPGRAPAKEPQWRLDVGKLALDISRFEGTGREELAAVPDAQARGPSNLTVGTDVDVALRYDSQGASWESRVLLAYRAVTVDDGAPQESMDDIQISTATDLPLARFPRAPGFHLRPFGELLWDSEFTPREVEGVGSVRQSDLFFTLGLSSSWKWLRRFRLGSFLNQDLSRLENKAVQFGGRLDLETSWTLPPSSSLRLDTRSDLRVWANTPGADASDLRVRFLGEVRLLAQPIRWLQAGVFFQSYLAQGRADINDVLGFSWTLGGTIQMSASFDLSRPLRPRLPPRWRREISRRSVTSE